MTKTIACLYDTFHDARDAADRLERLGVPASDIGLVSISGDPHAPSLGLAGTRMDDARTGAEAGLALGGVVGLAAGIVALPAALPVLAVGWLATTAAGALAGLAAGNLVGGLIGHGHPEDQAHVLAEGVRRGCTMVSARVPFMSAARMRAAMAMAGSVNLGLRQVEWHREGWHGFDPHAPAFSPEEVVAERMRHVLPRAA